MYYVIRSYDYYLEEYELNNNIIETFKFSKTCKKLFDNYEAAYEIKKSLFIEIGIKCEIEEFMIGE